MSYSADHTLEGLLKLPPESFVLACYRTILRREGDPPGIANYTAQVAANADRLAVAAAFASSDEAMALPAMHKRRVAEVLAAHAMRLVQDARTSKMRRHAAVQVARYLSVLSGIQVGPANENEADADAADPFHQYLREVIEGSGHL